mgnify:CR=1 FL=1
MYDIHIPLSFWVIAICLASYSRIFVSHYQSGLFTRSHTSAVTGDVSSVWPPHLVASRGGHPTEYPIFQPGFPRGTYEQAFYQNFCIRYYLVNPKLDNLTYKTYTISSSKNKGWFQCVLFKENMKRSLSIGYRTMEPLSSSQSSVLWLCLAVAAVWHAGSGQHGHPERWQSVRGAEARGSVSYTHLTLPTICSV